MATGFAGLEGFGIQKGDKWTVQGCISPVWDTCLIVQALGGKRFANRRSYAHCGDPLAGRTADSRWRGLAGFRRPRCRRVVGHSSSTTIATPTSTIRLRWCSRCVWQGCQTMRTTCATTSLERAVTWVGGMQNRDGGWASFDKNNNHGYVTALTFSDFGEVLDPSSADVTAHVIEMYGKLGYQTDLPSIQAAYRYLRAEQEDDGSWFGRWGVNYVYGLGAVLPGLEAIGEDMRQPYVRRAVQWLVEHQNLTAVGANRVRRTSTPTNMASDPAPRLKPRGPSSR